MKCNNMKQHKGVKYQSGGNYPSIDSAYYNRPEYGLYDAAEMAKMGAKVGGSRQKGVKYQSGGNYPAIDSAYFNRPEYGLYDAAEMAKMGAKVGGSKSKDTYIVEQYVRSSKQRGGFVQEENKKHVQRIKGIIENMIVVSNSSDKDILDIIKNEINPRTNLRYGREMATQILKEYYVQNPIRAKYTTIGSKNILRANPSNLLKNFFKENQVGGNRVVLPLTFFTGEIPNKITIPAHIDNYCQ